MNKTINLIYNNNLMDVTMIRKQQFQVSILDGALSGRKKRSRSDNLLEDIDKFIDWSPLAKQCEVMFKKSNRGRPATPIIFSLKCLFIQFLYGLSEPGLEDALIDRLSFQRFLRISFDEEIPNFTTIWKFKARLIKHKLYDKLFDTILEQLESKNLILKKGTLIDATIVQSARRPHKEKTDHTEHKEREVKERSSQKDYDATHTRKGKKKYYGYKGHIGVDQGTNIIRTKAFTTASPHDSQKRDELICGDEASVFADKAYDDDTVKRKCREKGVYYGILDKGRRNRPLSQSQKKRNKKKSRVRNAVERPFAHFKNLYAYSRVRYLTLERNDLHFTFLCMIHNVRRGIALDTMYNII
jgi:IS5 family transposase